MADLFRDFEMLEVEIRENSIFCTINRPKVLNALNRQVLLEMTEFVEGVAAMPELRVVVLQGAGDKAFVAGADIAQMSDMDARAATEFSALGQELTEKIENLPQLTIAKVQGFALGGGCELAMAADIIVASTRARFGQPEVNLGLIAGFGGTQRLTDRVGLALAIDILCGGRQLKGAEAAAHGLVARVVEPELLDETVAKIIENTNKTGPHAITVSKSLARASCSKELHQGLQLERSAFGALFEREESREGLNAFLDKRSPAF
jgi:enoyl-CoA hydratase